MMLIFVFLIVFSFYCSYKNYATRYSLGFLSIVWSLIGLIYISMHKVACLDSYTSVKLFNSLDYRLFMFLIKPRFSLFTLTRMFNICSAWYILSLILFSFSYMELPHRLKAVYITPALGFVGFYVMFYDPSHIYSVYRKVVESGSDASFHTLAVVDLLVWICVVLIFLLPWIIMLINYRKLQSPYSKKQVAGVSLFVLFTNFIYIIIFKLTNTRVIYFRHDASTILSPVSFKFDFSYTYIMLMFVCIGCMIYILSYFNIARTNGFLKRLHAKIKMKNKNAETYKILHSVKNTIISYNILLEDIINTEDEAEKNKQLLSLHSKISDYLAYISSPVSAAHPRDDFWLEKISAETFMNNIIEKYDCPDGVSIKKLYTPGTNNIHIDTFYLEEAVMNILTNAVQATQDAGGGEVGIDIKPELGWISISISDSGAGISRKIRKSMFKPFFTTKMINTNWGMGLSYALEIINMHGGKISFRSKIGRGTEFFILLPKHIKDTSSKHDKRRIHYVD